MAKRKKKVEPIEVAVTTKYEILAAIVCIGGVVRKKEDKFIFDPFGNHAGLKGEILAAFKAGFLKEVK